MVRSDAGRFPCFKTVTFTLAVLLSACSPSPSSSPQVTGASARIGTGRTSSALTSTYATMYLRGTMNSWGSTQMTLVADNTWQVAVTLAAGNTQYKFDVAANWATNFGDNGADGFANDSGGANINFNAPSAGSYLFKFNDNTKAYSVVANSVPATPTNFTATAGSSTTINLSWTASSGASTYSLTRSTSATGTFSAVVTQSGVTYTDSGLTAGTTYYYQLVASNSVGSSTAATASATTSAAGTFTSQYPSMYLRGSMNSWGSTQMALVADSTWRVAVTLPAGSNQYKFDVAANWATNFGDNGADGFANDSGGSNINYNAAAAGTYTFTFNDNTKAYSVTSAPPAAPTGVTATVVSSTAINLSWTASAGASSYTVTRSTSASSGFASVGSPTTATTFSDSGLTASTTYYYQVVATNAAGSATSATANATTLSANADVTPPSITASPGAGQYTTTQTVTFTLTDDKTATSTAYYTVDGSTPSTSSTVFLQGNASAGLTKTATVSTTTTFNFLLVDAAGNQARASFAYQIGATPTLTDFRKESIYFLIISRFYDGDTSNNMHCWDDVASVANNPDSDPCYRGDFKGLINKLDYIKALGFSAIWITPVVENASGYDYHGYHALNFKKIDPRLLSGDTNYQSVIAAIHAKGMKVIQDIVLNHTGNFGEENLFPLFTKNWSNIYNSSNQAISINADTAAGLVNIDAGGKLPSNYSTLTPNNQYSARITAMKTDASDTNHIYHHEQSLQWEGYTVETGQIAGDCVDLDTENPTVASYLRDAYGSMVTAGVDGFRIDTVKHISRLTLNNEFFPQMTALGGQNFFMFGEVAALYENVINSGIPAISPFFYTWKESKSYAWGDRVTNEASTLANWNDNSTTNNLPSSNNAFLSGITYHAPDYTQSNNFHVIDFPMHWAFINAHNAFNMALSNDQLYNDSTWNVVYVASHDYSPDQAPQTTRFSQPQAVWAENLDLEFTFRGIPALYNGDEIEFQKNIVIDAGNTKPIAQTGRAYFGANLEGTVNATGFGQYTATGTVANTLAYPLAVHVRELNMIRRGIPALQMGQYSVSSTYVPNNNGGIAFVRRYTSGGTDSLALVAISANATFANIPNGTYVDAVTGNSINVTAGTLTTTGISSQGNMRVYVLNGSKLTDSTAQTYLK